MPLVDTGTTLAEMLKPLERLGQALVNEVLFGARDALGEASRLKGFERQTEHLRATL